LFRVKFMLPMSYMSMDRSMGRFKRVLKHIRLVRMKFKYNEGAPIGGQSCSG
jgi:hypothetical protein